MLDDLESNLLSLASIVYRLPSTVKIPIFGFRQKRYTKMIWKQQKDMTAINAMGDNNLGSHLGMEFVEQGDDYLIARMPVDERTRQPFGLLHGGASAALAETLGSVASFLCLPDPEKEMAVGVEINCNHLRPAFKGFVYGKVSPYRVGRSMHVWNIEIRDERERLVCVSRLTIAIVPRQK